MNFVDNLELYRKKFELLNLPEKKSATFVCMYGFKNSLAQDLILFQFIRSLGGPSVFVQKYLPPLGCLTPIDIDKFFDDEAKHNINQLIKVVFYRNMKSMENYYRWVSVEYTKKFRKIHYPLVNTIFRYNRRHLKAHYIEMLKGYCK